MYRCFILCIFSLLIIVSAAADATASESSKLIAGQQFFSLHAARNMAAHNRMPQVRTSDRFIALKRGDDNIGIPLPPRPSAETIVASGKPSRDMTTAQAKQILSIFAPSD